MPPRRSARQPKGSAATPDSAIAGDVTIPQLDGEAAVPKTRTPKKPKSPAKAVLEEHEEINSTTTAVLVKGKKGVKLKQELKEEADAIVEPADSKTTKFQRKRKTTTNEEKVEFDEEGPKKITKKRKTKEEKEEEMIPLAARSALTALKKPYHIGAHVSAAGGVQNAITAAVHIGGNSFALFLKSQRKWVSPPLADEARDQFHAYCKEHQYDPAKHVLPHGSYLVNLAQIDEEKAEQAYQCFVDDLKRCDALGIGLYNFHPGSTGPHPKADAIARIAKQLNKAHKATKTVITLLENMCGSGNIVGSTWEDLRDIIALVDDKSRVGVCIDSCHAFAAGYDLRSPGAFKKSMDSFDSVVGMKYLKALHINDSKAPLDSHRDLHANIGTGFLGLRAFHNIMNFEPFQGLPMVLETPIDTKGPDGKTIEDKGVWAKEIKLLESLIDADAESDAFKADEKRLWDLGKEERQKIQAQVDKKAQKEVKSKNIKDMFKAAANKGKKGRKASKEEADSGEENSDGGCSH